MTGWLSRRRTRVAVLVGTAGIALGACGGRPGHADRVVARLAGELASAETRLPVARIDLGTESAAPHLVRGWSCDETIEAGDGSFVWSHGNPSVVTFRWPDPLPLRIVLSGFPFEYPGAPPQTVDVDLNGHTVGAIRLEPGLRDYEVRVDPPALRRGANRLELRYGHTARPADVLPGSGDPRPLAVGWIGIRFESAEFREPSPPHVKGKESLWIPYGAEVAYFLELPAKARLRLMSVEADSVGEGFLAVRVTSEDERVREVDVRPGGRFELALTEDEAAIREIALEARGGPARGGLVIRRPEVLAPARRDAGGSAAARGGRSPGRANVLLYLVDTLRRDALGCYGNPDAWTPHVDAFARRGVQFRCGSAQAPWTRPSTASVLTGLHPQVHGVRGGKDALPGEAATLAEILGERGYRSASFLSNPNLAPGLGFEQGFSESRYFPDATLSSDSLGSAAAAWLPEESGGAPFFLWVHTMDPHAPYAPPPGFRERYHPDPVPPDVGSIEQLAAFTAGTETPSPDAPIRLTALYRGEVARNDRGFGRMLRALEARGLENETIVVFVSDHGEEFLEHGGWEHARTIFREVGNVPLVIRPAGDGAAAGSLGDRADHVDIVPTILELLGIEAGPFSGVALLPVGRRDADRPSLQSNRLDGWNASAITRGSWKLIRWPDGGRRTFLFDLAHDPGELHDVFDARPVLAAFLDRQLDLAESGLGPPVGRAEAALDAAATERLRALGYLQ